MFFDWGILRTDATILLGGHGTNPPVCTRVRVSSTSLGPAFREWTGYAPASYTPPGKNGGQQRRQGAVYVKAGRKGKSLGPEQTRARNEGLSRPGECLNQTGECFRRGRKAFRSRPEFSAGAGENFPYCPEASCGRGESAGGRPECCQWSLEPSASRPKSSNHPPHFSSVPQPDSRTRGNRANAQRQRPNAQEGIAPGATPPVRLTTTTVVSSGSSSRPRWRRQSARRMSRMPPAEAWAAPSSTSRGRSKP